MASKSQQSKTRDGALSTLNVAVEALNLAKEVTSITPAKAVFGAVSTLLTMIRDSMTNRSDYIEIGLSCADVCQAFDRGLGDKGSYELSQSVLEAIEQLTTTVTAIQAKVVKQEKRSPVSKVFHAKDDKDTIAAWKQDLNRVLHVFNTELSINTHVMVADLHRRTLTCQEKASREHHLAQTSISAGESPPPPPRACFGRDELIEKIIDLVESGTPIALVGPGGIGKTSLMLTALHHNRIKKLFGNDRRFIRCDQFPASRTSFLSRLSKAIGAAVENPEDLAPLRPFLSSRKIFIIIDNLEAIIDPQGPDAQAIYDVIEELCGFSNICLAITSRIATIPPDYEILEIPTLSLEAARDTFYRINKYNERPDLIDNILAELDFHPLSVTLLATVAHQNRWNNHRLVREWEQRQTGVLHTEHNRSFAATIELSLASPMFRELGTNARELLGVVAFFPQGVDEKNLDWLFPTISNGNAILDKFCILSLTYRSNGFITMLAPLRDHLRPKDPKSSPLLSATKERYFTRMSVEINPNDPLFAKSRWITSEDVNVEHLLDVFTSADVNCNDVWGACANFIRHLSWHKHRHTMLWRKIERLPDNHHLKPECLFELAQLFYLVGNYVEQKRLLSRVLELQRGRGNDYEVARTLGLLSAANRPLNLRGEGIKQAREALEIFTRLGSAVRQASCLCNLALLLHTDNQLDAAEEAASQAISLLPEKGEEFLVCQSHRILGDIYHSKGERERAIFHFEQALGIATLFNWDDQLFWTHYSLAWLFFIEGSLDDAHVHVEKAKIHTTCGTYCLGCAILLQARTWYRQHKFDKALSEILRAREIFEKLGAADHSDACGRYIRSIERAAESPAAFGDTGFDGMDTSPSP